jgi:hypothetical protein
MDFPVYFVGFITLIWGISALWTRRMIVTFESRITLELTGWRAVSGGLLNLGVGIFTLVSLRITPDETAHVVICGLNMGYYLPGMILLYLVEYYDFDPDENKLKRKPKPEN